MDAELPGFDARRRLGRRHGHGLPWYPALAGARCGADNRRWPRADFARQHCAKFGPWRSYAQTRYPTSASAICYMAMGLATALEGASSRASVPELGPARPPLRRWPPRSASAHSNRPSRQTGRYPVPRRQRHCDYLGPASLQSIGNTIHWVGFALATWAQTGPRAGSTSRIYALGVRASTRSYPTSCPTA